MYQEQLENFIYHHIHEWAKEYVESNIEDYPDTTLYDSMDHEFRTFMQDLEHRFEEEIKPRFGDV
jgi:TorA maturation chaperone TorD